MNIIKKNRRIIMQININNLSINNIGTININICGKDEDLDKTTESITTDIYSILLADDTGYALDSADDDNLSVVVSPIANKWIVRKSGDNYGYVISDYDDSRYQMTYSDDHKVMLALEPNTLFIIEPVTSGTDEEMVLISPLENPSIYIGIDGDVSEDSPCILTSKENALKFVLRKCIL